MEYKTQYYANILNAFPMAITAGVLTSVSND